MIGRQLLLGAIEGRTPTQMMAGVASDKAYTAGKDLIEDVFFNHKKTLEDKIGGFNKHFDKQIMKHKTRYAEEINVQNKNKIDDVKGLDAAYSNVNGITKIGNTLYIGGTGAKTGLNHKVNDVIADLFLIPTHNVQLSERYKDAMEELRKNPDVDRLVGHSLGSSVVQEINNRHGNKYASTVYSSPFVSGINQQKNPRHLRFRNRGDPIAMFDDAAITGEIESNNLLDKHSFNNWTGQGMTEINPTTDISNGFNPNDNSG